MKGSEHVKAAEELLEKITPDVAAHAPDIAHNAFLAAQVHATLALVAAQLVIYERDDWE